MCEPTTSQLAMRSAYALVPPAPTAPAGTAPQEQDARDPQAAPAE
jgi:hypothetical protein